MLLGSKNVYCFLERLKPAYCFLKGQRPTIFLTCMPAFLEKITAAGIKWDNSLGNSARLAYHNAEFDTFVKNGMNKNCVRLLR